MPHERVQELLLRELMWMRGYNCTKGNEEVVRCLDANA